MKKTNAITKIVMLLSLIAIIISPIKVEAASASITASKTTAYVGDNVTITVKTTAGAWNLSVNGSGISDSIVGYDLDGNKTTTKTYTLNTSKVGRFKIHLPLAPDAHKEFLGSVISKSVPKELL